MTAAFWNKLAERYSKKPVDNPEAFERKIAITKKLMHADELVVDLGCGTGSLLLRLASSGAKLHGLDLSSEMIRIAREKARSVENITFHVGPFDDEFTALEDGSVDGVCAFSFLHLVDERERALAHIFRLLKPGGFFVSSTVCLGDSRLPYGVILRVLRALGKAPRVAVITPEALDDEIERAGFVDLQRPDVGAGPQTAFRVAHRSA